jgi:carbamoyltransferase
MNILGISAYYHDSAAALLQDGTLVAAAQEERFSRRKNDARFPGSAIRYCMEEARLPWSGLDYVVFYDKPLLKFDRLLETYLAYAPRGFRSFAKAMPVWLKEKLYLKRQLRRELSDLADGAARDLPPLMFAAHHQAHAASAFFPSPFERAGVLCMDGVGEWATASVWEGNGNALVPQWQVDFPHSVGMLYSAFTYFTGFKVNSGEYKLMGLAPYGEPKYADLILDRLVDLKDDGTFRLDMSYFDYPAGLRMVNERFERLFGGPARDPASPLTQREMDIAASVQRVVEEIVIRLARTVHRELAVDRLCLAGGVALNCVANGRLLREGPFKDIWIQPAAGDAGGAVGAAFALWHEYLGEPRAAVAGDAMAGSFLGPQFSAEQIGRSLDALGARYSRLADATLLPRVAEVLAQEKVVGWMQGRMEFGPRALGARSIIADPRSATMQKTLNLKIKHRESFRPFAPSVAEDRAGEYFELDRPSPYMLVTAPVKQALRIPVGADQERLFGIEKLNVVRSRIPAVTHVDHSARVQTVHRSTNPRYYALLEHFEERTGCAVLVNTSFNVRGEPMVCTPEDAYRCFMRTDLDYLVIEDFLLAKSEQPRHAEDLAWRQEFEPD